MTTDTPAAAPPPLTEADYEARWDAIQEALGDAAREHDWCSEFETFCANNDIESRRNGRTRTYTFSVTLSYSPSLGALDRFLEEEYGGSHDVSEYVEVESSITVDFTTDSEPQDVTVDDLDDAIQGEGYRGWDSADITDYEETYE